MFSLARQFLGLSDKSNASTDNERSGELPSEIVNSPSSNPTPSSISAKSFHNSPRVFTTDEIYGLISKDNKKSIHEQTFLKIPKKWSNDDLDEKWKKLFKTGS